MQFLVLFVLVFFFLNNNPDGDLRALNVIEHTKVADDTKHRCYCSKMHSVFRLHACLSVASQRISVGKDV